MSYSILAPPSPPSPEAPSFLNVLYLAFYPDPASIPSPDQTSTEEEEDAEGLEEPSPFPPAASVAVNTVASRRGGVSAGAATMTAHVVVDTPFQSRVTSEAFLPATDYLSVASSDVKEPAAAQQHSNVQAFNTFDRHSALFPPTFAPSMLSIPAEAGHRFRP